MRRFLPLLAALLAMLLAACSTLGSALLSRDISFTAAQLQSQLTRNFPRDPAGGCDEILHDGRGFARRPRHDQFDCAG